MRLLTFKELKRLKGIPYCRDHLRRKVKAGEFPKPIQVGPGRIAWIEEEVDAKLAELAAERLSPELRNPRARGHPKQDKP